MGPTREAYGHHSHIRRFMSWVVIPKENHLRLGHELRHTSSTCIEHARSWRSRDSTRTDWQIGEFLWDVPVGRRMCSLPRQNCKRITKICGTLGHARPNLLFATIPTLGPLLCRTWWSWRLPATIRPDESPVLPAGGWGQQTVYAMNVLEPFCIDYTQRMLCCCKEPIQEFSQALTSCNRLKV